MDAYVGGAGGARIVLHTELFLSLLSSGRAFSGIIVDSLRASDPKLSLCY